MGPRDLLVQGEGLPPTPWDIAHELRYWADNEKDLDLPLYKDWILYRKFDRLNFT